MHGCREPARSDHLSKNKADWDTFKVKKKKMHINLVNLCVNSNYLEGGRIPPPPVEDRVKKKISYVLGSLLDARKCARV